MRVGQSAGNDSLTATGFFVRKLQRNLNGVRMHRIVTLLIAGLLALLPAAYAQKGWDGIQWSDRDDGWMTVSLKQNCTLLLFLDARSYSLRVFEEGNQISYSARGECDKRGLAQGRIVLEINYLTSNPGSYEQTFIFEGTARNGVFEGKINQIDVTPLVPSGRAVMPLHMKGGCPYYIDPDTGQIDHKMPYGTGYPYDSGIFPPCSTEGADYLRQQIAARQATPATPPPVASAPATSPSQRLLPSTPAPAGNADVWSSCISNPEPRARDGGIQALWDITNSCPNAVIVRYCFRAQFEAAGDPNLCRRREMRTHEIAPKGKLTFDFNLMPAGTVLSDGRTVTSNTLLVSGFACTGGNFPDAYFDSDGSFRSRGC